LWLNIAPLARQCGVALAFAPAGAKDGELLAADPCACRTTDQDPDPAPREVVALRCQGRDAGKVLLCGGPVEIRRALRASIESTMKRIDLESTEEAHLENLYMSSESLDAVYEISSQIWSGRPRAELLEDIMKRAAVMRPGLQAVLWLVGKNGLEPVAGALAQQLTVRPLDQGVLGRVLGGKGFLKTTARVWPPWSRTSRNSATLPPS